MGCDRNRISAKIIDPVKQYAEEILQRHRYSRPMFGKHIRDWIADPDGLQKVLLNEYKCDDLNLKDPSISPNDRKLNYIYNNTMLQTMHRSRNDQDNLQKFLKSIAKLTEDELLEIQFWQETCDFTPGKPFFFCYQSQHMKQLLVRYGQDMAQLDATHSVNRVS